ncbi:elongation factor P 5-aminopentanone reductase [Aquibacillus sediminis]|uniref:elongation factor P 5-aminopentanone reductase n=1 Tax=Aquibacillus sediminis TaxID=2574734 RepID=UPI0011085D21|nr:SDR family oxidoreductase [Aquibacillus sediminis]
MRTSCLIIGASGEIGQAIAHRLVTEGYDVLLHYHRNEAEIKKLVSQLPEESLLGVVKGDLSTNEGIHTFINQFNFPIENIVFTSGQSDYGLFQDTSETLMDEMIALHVKAPWMITKHVIPDMVRNQSGNIILVTSIWGEVGASCEVVYSSVKGAQNTFVKALAKELAGSGISVNAVSPGFIDTKMNHNLSEIEKNDIISQIPINRAGKPNEVAHVVAFLLDERSKYIQGEIVNVTGSW